jgi:carbon-monoxide dehydrogenase medium subunit
MYAAPFEYYAPTSVAEALALLDRHQDDAKILSGSQSLVPLMKLRLAQPKHVIDLRKVPGLSGVQESGGAVQIGAFTTHYAVGTSKVVRARLPMMAEAAAQIGDVQVRNMGTIGGSLAHADPSADWPAVLTALEASVQIVSAKGERLVKVEQLIIGPLTTVLEPRELLVQVRVPVPAGRSGGAYEKLPHPASRFAVVGVAALLSLDAKGAVQSARVALTGLAPKVTRASSVEKALQGKTPDPATLKAAAARAAEGIELRADLTGSADYRAHLAAVYTERALGRAAARAREG